jgi:hypothetical protein
MLTTKPRGMGAVDGIEEDVDWEDNGSRRRRGCWGERS